MVVVWKSHRFGPAQRGNIVTPQGTLVAIIHPYQRFKELVTGALPEGMRARLVEVPDQARVERFPSEPQPTVRPPPSLS